MYDAVIHLVYGLYLCLSYTMVRRERGRSDLDDDVSNVGWLMLIVTSVVGFAIDTSETGIFLLFRQVCAHLVASCVGWCTSRYLVHE